jgi:hypothetical protein
VWEWNELEDRPELRPWTGEAAQPQAAGSRQQGGTVDLLTRQLRANIWV